jgi:hypothetical protein
VVGSRLGRDIEPAPLGLPYGGHTLSGADVGDVDVGPRELGEGDVSQDHDGLRGPGGAAQALHGGSDSLVQGGAAG